MASWILPKNFQYIKFPQHSFFGRIQDTIFFFEIYWPLEDCITVLWVKNCHYTLIFCSQLSVFCRSERLALGLTVWKRMRTIEWFSQRSKTWNVTFSFFVALSKFFFIQNRISEDKLFFFFFNLALIITKMSISQNLKTISNQI